jgi:predicted membrane-bound dolichyl-phosphate-mannose-protein mannosyltransferase
MDKPRKFAWHHPGWYSLILINVIVYAVVAAFVQKRAKIAIGLCGEHRRRRRNFSIAAMSIFVVGIVALFLAIGAEEDGSLYGVASGLALLAGVVLAIVGSRVLTPQRITTEEARLKGCCDAFLDNLHTR